MSSVLVSFSDAITMVYYDFTVSTLVFVFEKVRSNIGITDINMTIGNCDYAGRRECIKYTPRSQDLYQ